eukprot:TRINITY_DN12382_c0_g1_i1.p1 TRINITY_DN12382_c0_g1~~TRINITY_DN12382_c0_g1_i1.p1  ORF type:complete len:347 (-),score=71.47 TRINITY_DN12382_c0_g1_i1:56-1096(-)
MAELRRRGRHHTDDDTWDERSGRVEDADDSADERKPLISREKSERRSATSQALITPSSESSNILSLLLGAGGFTKFMEFFQRLFDYMLQNLSLKKSVPFVLSASEQQALEEFKSRTSKSFDLNDEEHQKVLHRLWKMSFSDDREGYAPTSDKWKMLGFQTNNPSTDFRGAGIFGLSNLIYFGEKYPRRFNKAVGDRNNKDFDLSQYPFAISGLNVTMLLFELLGWGFKAKLQNDSEPYPLYRRNFIKLLLSQPPKQPQTEDLIKFDDDSSRPEKRDLMFDEISIFEEVYCAAFMILDEEWTKRKATYLEFPTILQETRKRTQDLLSKVISLDDLLQHNEHLSRKLS